MENSTNYKVCLTSDARNDIVEIKRYILNTFRYRETAEAFSKNIKYVISKLSPFSKAYAKTGLLIQGLEVYYKPHSSYLLFFVVKENKVIVIRILKDRLHWQSIINRIISFDQIIY
ncbi:type II toxin-antitoxin system RelE/ParE family toxin [Lacrimispora sp. 38-1]|uniref:type II toxin-antitoxin system RelE/ParE family toxin n=1 Tax=Lacrimispora sp. 38-1 TaxID=3125778 RepID=UPI003CEA11D4